MPDNTTAIPPMEPMQQAVGRGIQAFATVEMVLSRIFALIMHPAPHEISFIALDSARHLETKLRITRKVGQRRLTKDSLPEFNRLMERIKDRAGMRHKLAHWTTGYWHKDGVITRTVQLRDTEVRLIQNYFSERNLDWEPTDSIRLEQINEFIGMCTELSNELIIFSITLQGWMDEAEKRGDVLTRQVGR